MTRTAATNVPEINPVFGSEFEGPLVANATALFRGLSLLHQLPEHDGALLSLAADLHRHTAEGARGEEILLWAIVATLPHDDSLVVEAVSDLARHMLTYDAHVAWEDLGDADRRRIVWLAGILRLADAIAEEFGWCVEGAYATWTDLLLHIELDGAQVDEAGLRRVLARTAALEVASERRIVLTSSHQRRSGAA